MNTREKGKQGECEAADYLVGNGYKVISRNYQSRKGEIDIVAQGPDGTLAFVEVKAGSSMGYGHPFFRVTRAKQRIIAQMAEQYMADHGLTDTQCRFDVIAVHNDGDVEHLRNAFLA